ncbi:competence protein CoiA [Bacillus kwashiorkori]|uniref:competence protein CoiA n=1 Tax=Bacillus kwashiorkori TaxID=1522318 RepID=UPI000780C342|nr:competence protein CoiA family protein [Bacillus kwashiorkori]
MFFALTNSGKSITLLKMTVSEIHQLKKEQPFYCPHCNGELILKVGSKKLPHFAHKYICPVKPEGETAAHLSGKKLLHDWLVAQQLQPKMEIYFPDINQRADILFYWKKKPFIFEFQCSSIPVNELERRTKAYHQANFTPLWITHQDKIGKISNHILSITDYLSFFITNFPQNSEPMILAFHPEKRQFQLIYHFMPISTRKVLVQQMNIGYQTTLQQLFSFQKPIPQHFFQYWYIYAEKWLFHLPLYNNARRNKFLTFLYQNNIHPTKLPMEVGVPVPYMILIETPPIIWQTYIFLFLFNENRGRRYIFLKELTNYLQKIVKEGLLRFRLTQYSFLANKYMPIKKYLVFLENVGLVKLKEDKLFVNTSRMTNVHYRKTRQQSFNQFLEKNRGKILQLFY